MADDANEQDPDGQAQDAEHPDGHEQPERAA